MSAAAGYVGAEPEGLRLLSAALDGVELDLRFTAMRVAELLAEAGEDDASVRALRLVASEVEASAGDIRRRATIAEDLAPLAAAPLCVVPWWDPLRRAAIAVRDNAGRFIGGGIDTFASSGATVWRLTPINGQWRQEWVDLAAGLRAAVDDPGAALSVAAGMDVFDERGWSYWLGGIVPDLALTAAGGVGVANRTLRVVDTMDDMADVAAGAGRLKRLSAAAAVATRRNVVPGDGMHPTPFGIRRPDPVIEPVSRQRVIDADKATKGHSAARHGPETTLEQQQIRAETRVRPDGGKDKKQRDASRFFRWQDQSEAIEEAERRWRNGERNDKGINVTFEHLVGEGYMAGGRTYRRTHVVTVRVDAKGRAFTSYPNLEFGG